MNQTQQKIEQLKTKLNDIITHFDQKLANIPHDQRHDLMKKQRMIFAYRAEMLELLLYQKRINQKREMCE